MLQEESSGASTRADGLFVSESEREHERERENEAEKKAVQVWKKALA